jgi:alpha-beta hydrolase superfamily lysophospholipase
MDTHGAEMGKKRLLLSKESMGIHIIALLCCATPAPALDLGQLREDLRPLDVSVPYEPTPAVADYFDFYDLSPPGAEHWFGTMASEGETVAAHFFLPRNPVGTLFLVHGFLDHTAFFSKLIHEGVARNYAVVSWDLPGHGLTSGVRTETGDFALCAAQLERILERVKDRAPRPFHLIAHSTGGSIAMEYLHNAGTRHFDRIVLLAPLVRHAHWSWGKFGYSISNPFTGHIGRKAKINTSDPAHVEFALKDPLRIETISYEYLEDLYEWEERAREYPEWEGPVLIIQGDRDDVVDWKYNLEFLRKKLPDAETRIIPGARHQLANESDEYRIQVFDMAFGWLSKQTP